MSGTLIPNTGNREKYNNEDVTRVKISNGDDTPVPVYLTDDAGTIDFFTYYDDTNLVPPSVNTKIIEYTVPAGKVLDLDRITCSGENFAKYTVLIDGNTNKTLRTHYGDGLNLEINYSRFKVLAGQKIEVFTIHYNIGMDGDFEATIEGRIS